MEIEGRYARSHNKRLLVYFRGWCKSSYVSNGRKTDKFVFNRHVMPILHHLQYIEIDIQRVPDGHSEGPFLRP